MRKFFGNRRNILTAILPAIIFLSALSVAHGQTYFCYPVITSVSPSVWIVGQTTNVTIKGTNFYNPGGDTCYLVWATVTENTGLVAFSQANVISPSEIDAVVTVPSTVPAETACVAVVTGQFMVVRANASSRSNTTAGATCAGDATSSAFPVQIEGCTPATITSISPNVWFAGQTYNNVTITGTNFVTNDMATAACPTTTATITTPSGASVALGAVTVNSPTQITIASVKPPTSETTEGATLAVNGEASPQPNVDVLGQPQIECTGASMRCNGSFISTSDGSTPTPQDAVVSQPINLSFTPSATDLAALPIFVDFSSTTPYTWTVESTNIGGYTVVQPACPSATSSATLTPTVLTDPTLTTYWLYPNSPAPVTLQYCVSDSALGADNIQCSEVATANFNVMGPTATITPVLSVAGTLGATDSWDVSAGIPGCSTPTFNPGQMTQFLGFEMFGSGGTNCTPTLSISGIAFQAPDSYTAGGAAPNGTFEWVQLVTNDGVTANGSLNPVSLGTGLDNTYPYLAVNAYGAYDAPNVGLDNTLSTEQSAFMAQMYLLWDSMLDPTDVPAPIGYLTWTIYGGAINSAVGSPSWFLSPATTGAKASTQYTPGDPTTSPYGLPTWTQASCNSTAITAQPESEPTDEKETQQ